MNISKLKNKYLQITYKPIKHKDSRVKVGCTIKDLEEELENRLEFLKEKFDVDYEI